MLQLAIPFLAVLFVGLGIAIETPTNALLGKSLNSALWASLVSFIVGTLVLGVAAAATRPRLPEGWSAATPWYAWVGGVYGAAVVLASAWATPKLGAGATLVVIVASQVALGVALDHFGVFGLTQHPAGWLRIGGVLVVTIGAVLVSVG
ncbi:DMT family transporter [Caulobacter sp. S45]|uniref:DMT family transporter n=1 Tax=Caulobacter sp. S45 TaxID=1641861 RepID=UPI0015759D6A|nr:DMT family transporter [Caulobacter sp. S45]